MKVRLIALLLVLALVPTTAGAAPTFEGLARKRVFTKADTRWVIGKAAKHYRLSDSDTAWLKRAAVDIVYDGAHESGGSVHAGRGRNCQGIVQFNRGWRISKYERRLLGKYEPHHRNEWRMSGIVSLYRMARVMRDGGKAAVRRHWHSTYGH